MTTATHVTNSRHGYSGAGWMQRTLDYQKPPRQLSEFGVIVADLLGDLNYGIYHFDSGALLREYPTYLNRCARRRAVRNARLQRLDPPCLSGTRIPDQGDHRGGVIILPSADISQGKRNVLPAEAPNPARGGI